MIFAPVKPSVARQYFKKRLFMACITFGAMFLIPTTLLAWIVPNKSESFLPQIVGTTVAGLVTYYVYVLWNKQPMRIRCSRCRGIVLCRTPWVCGECGHENWDVRKTTILDRCEECHIPAKSYVCHHCNESMFFSEDRDKSNPARRISVQAQEPRARKEKQRRGEEEFLDEKALLEREVEKSKIALTNEQVKAQIELVKKGLVVVEGQLETELDIQMQSLEEFMDKGTAIREAVRRRKALNAERYKKDPKELRECNLMVDAWARSRLPEKP